MTSWVSRAALTVATTLTIAALTTAPAAAHAALESSNPAENAALDSAPDQVTLTFNQDVQPAFAALTVVGSDDTQWAASEPVVDGRTVSVDLDGLGDAGQYTIGFRVVSADGRPITGSIPFQLTQAAPRPASSTTTSAPAMRQAANDAESAAPAENEDDGGFPAWIVVVAVVAVGAAGVAYAVRQGPDHH